DSSAAVWNSLLVLSEGQTGQSSAGRGFAAWVPESPSGYNSLFVNDDFKGDAEARLRMIRRAHILSPGIALYAVHESMTHIHEGRREQARAIAAELVSAGTPRSGEPTTDARLVAGQYVLAEVEANEGRFGAAMARARRVLFAQKKFGRLDADDIYILT